MANIQTIDRLINDGEYEKAIDALSEAIAAAPDDDSLHFRLGKLLWRLDRRAEATSEFLKAIAINPDSPANIALRAARDVADFFNPDLYNP